MTRSVVQLCPWALYVLLLLTTTICHDVIAYAVPGYRYAWHCKLSSLYFEVQCWRKRDDTANKLKIGTNNMQLQFQYCPQPSTHNHSIFGLVHNFKLFWLHGFRNKNGRAKCTGRSQNKNGREKQKMLAQGQSWTTDLVITNDVL